MAEPHPFDPAQPGFRPSDVIVRLLVVVSLLGAVALLALVAFPLAWRALTVEARRQTTDDAYTRGDLTVLGARVAGYIDEVLVGDFALVREGQPIVRIESDDYAARVDLATGGVEAQEAALSNLDRQIDEQRQVIEESKASLLATEADLALAAVNRDRAQKLMKSTFGTQQAVDEATAAYGKFQADKNRDQAGVALAQARLATLESQRGEIRAALRQANAQRSLAQIDLDRTTVAAPADGRMGQRSVFPGQYVAAGTAVQTLLPSGRLHVIANFKETQVRHFVPGLPASFTADAFPGRSFTGVVAELAPASGASYALLPADNATGNFTKVVQRVPVKIELDPGQPEAERLRAGLSVVVTVDTEGQPKPVPAVLPVGGVASDEPTAAARQ